MNVEKYASECKWGNRQKETWSKCDGRCVVRNVSLLVAVAFAELKRTPTILCRVEREEA